MSVAGGVDRAVDRAEHVGCRTLQVFTKNANQWTAPPIAPEAAARFRQRLTETGIAPVVSHDSYLINLASPDPALRDRSMAAFRDELERAEQLGLMGVVTHPGAHVGSGDDAGLDRVADALARILDETADFKVTILIENTAGQGTSLGWDFAHLERLLAGTGGHPRIGFCLDTCHLHVAGYDLTSDESYARVIADFADRIGLDRLRCMHLNDALKPLGSRVDRHTHIGEGTLGLAPFERIMRDRRLVGVPKILETPKEGDGIAQDLQNLATLARLAGCPTWPYPIASPEPPAKPEASRARVTAPKTSPKPPGRGSSARRSGSSPRKKT